MNNFQRKIIKDALSMKDKLRPYELKFIEEMEWVDEGDKQYILTTPQNKFLNSIGSKTARIIASKVPNSWKKKSGTRDYRYKDHSRSNKIARGEVVIFDDYPDIDEEID